MTTLTKIYLTKPKIITRAKKTTLRKIVALDNFPSIDLDLFLSQYVLEPYPELLKVIPLAFLDCCKIIMIKEKETKHKITDNTINNVLKKITPYKIKHINFNIF